MKLDVFIKGENIDLCIPTREFALNSKWYSWLNDPKINTFLEQGVFPNSPAAQLEFFESQEKNKDRLLLIISNKKKYLGVVSLSKIDLTRRDAGLAIILNSKLDPKYTSLIPLEAIARITEHGMTIMGLNRIYGVMNYKLSSWQQKLEILGYRVEAIRREVYLKGELSDSISIAITKSYFDKIRAIRGRYWDNRSKMEYRIQNLPKKKLVDELDTFFKSQGDTYYNKLIKL